MLMVKRSLFVIAVVACWTGWGPAAHADWATCQAKPTRACLFEEALRGDSGPLAGKDRLDVLVQGGALSHPEIVTAADLAEAQRLAQSTPNVTSLYYAYLAIHGLIAANQKQQAINLIGSLATPGQTLSLNAVQTLSITELVQSLVKAGDLETALAVPDRMQPPLDPKARPLVHSIVAVAATKALAEAGKTDQALMQIADEKYLTEAEVADLQTAVGQAFARRGDGKLAQDSYDRAEKNWEAARHYAAGASVQLRFASIRLLALRGQVDAVNAALQEVRSSPDAAANDPRTSYERSQGYQRVVAALLEAKQPEAALTLAKSITPDATKDAALAGVAVWYATNGRPADARAVQSLMTNTPDSAARVAVVRNLAIASAKQGDALAALRMAEEIKNPQSRRGALFAIALAMPQ